MRIRSISILAAALAVVSSVTPASAAVQLDPERNSTTQVGWGSLHAQDPAAINKWASGNDARVIDVEYEGDGKFSAQLVQNSGIFHRYLVADASWVYNISYAALIQKLVYEHKRAIDIEQYLAADGSTKFTAALVDNFADNYHSSTIVTGKTPDQIRSIQSTYDGNVVDLDYTGGGRYNAVLIKNTGVDATGGTWYTMKTPSEIDAIIKKDNVRLISMESDGAGTFAIVVTPGANQGWWYTYGATLKQTEELQQQTGARPIHVQSYLDKSGVEKYTAIFLDDQSRDAAAIRDSLSQVAQGVKFGFYLKQVDGGVIYSINENAVHDPGSSAKVLVSATEALRVKSGLDKYTNSMNYYLHPDAPTDVTRCAYDDAGNKLTSTPKTNSVFNTVSAMMQPSDNRATDGLLDRVGGFSAVNETAAKLQMTSTKYAVRLGCGRNIPDNLADRNSFTLRDLGKLYESTIRKDSPILGPESADPANARYGFENSMLDGAKELSSTVYEEATKMGIIDFDKVTDFVSKMKGRFKAGEATEVNPATATCGTGSCDKWIVRRAGDGWVSLPFKDSQGTIYMKKYVHGVFFDGDNVNCVTNCYFPAVKNNFTGMDKMRVQVYKDMLRPQIRAALTSWI
ncbi:serine hydrolase [Streptomyces sp. NPDC007355]|uniref:serine hydrolase n=1 Tax=Streptomyces sp. NPDC007355 TaxID=3364778 RepID=UPI0036C88F44